MMLAVSHLLMIPSSTTGVESAFFGMEATKINPKLSTQQSSDL